MHSCVCACVSTGMHPCMCVMHTGVYTVCALASMSVCARMYVC